jgi:hypothetical protein
MADCIFQNMHSAEYLALLDETSMLVSRQSDLVSLFNNGKCAMKPGIKFSSLFFSPKQEEDEVFASNTAIRATELTTLSQTRRSKFAWGCGLLSQMVVRPDVVFSQNGVLTGDVVMPDACCMPSKAAQLFHYRDWDSPTHAEWNHESPLGPPTDQEQKRIAKVEIDRRLHEIAGNIVQGVADAYRAVDPVQFKRFAQLADRGSWSLS